MKLVVTNKSVRWVALGTQWLLFTCAALFLSYYGYVTVDAWEFQREANQKLAHVPSSTPPVESSPRAAIEPDGLIGRIEIQRLGVSVVVVEGTGEAALRRAVGHILGTAMPGQPGNIGIAAHRDTFFRPLRNIRHGTTSFP